MTISIILFSFLLFFIIIFIHTVTRIDTALLWEGDIIFFLTLWLLMIVMITVTAIISFQPWQHSQYCDCFDWLQLLHDTGPLWMKMWSLFSITAITIVSKLSWMIAMNDSFVYILSYIIIKCLNNHLIGPSSNSRLQSSRMGCNGYWYSTDLRMFTAHYNWGCNKCILGCLLCTTIHAVKYAVRKSAHF